MAVPFCASVRHVSHTTRYGRWEKYSGITLTESASKTSGAYKTRLIRACSASRSTGSWPSGTSNMGSNIGDTPVSRIPAGRQIVIDGDGLTLYLFGYPIVIPLTIEPGGHVDFGCGGISTLLGGTVGMALQHRLQPLRSCLRDKVPFFHHARASL